MRGLRLEAGTILVVDRGYTDYAWFAELTHDRDAFDCGETALNEFLQRHARKSHELGGAKTFVAVGDADQKTILDFTV